MFWKKNGERDEASEPEDSFCWLVWTKWYFSLGFLKADFCLYSLTVFLSFVLEVKKNTCGHILNKLQGKRSFFTTSAWIYCPQNSYSQWTLVADQKHCHVLIVIHIPLQFRKAMETAISLQEDGSGVGGASLSGKLKLVSKLWSSASKLSHLQNFFRYY